MTGSDLLSILRKRTNDSAGADPTDAELVPIINEYVRFIWNGRVDSTFDTNGNARSKTELTAIGDTIDLDDQFKLTLLDGLAGEILMWKARNKEDQARAVQWAGMFRAAVGTR